MFNFSTLCSRRNLEQFIFCFTLQRNLEEEHQVSGIFNKKKTKTKTKNVEEVIIVLIVAAIKYCLYFIYFLFVYFLARLEADKVARQSQALWSACQALYRSVRAGCPGISWKHQLRPLTPEITAIKKAACTSKTSLNRNEYKKIFFFVIQPMVMS